VITRALAKGMDAFSRTIGSARGTWEEGCIDGEFGRGNKGWDSEYTVKLVPRRVLRARGST
jgi:hypothetical protein